ETERQIDQMEKDIESMCMRLLLQQHPVARDLRVISSALKMISDMERIGDQAADIAEISKYLMETEIPDAIHLRRMSDYAAGMVTRSINSFVNQDLDMARQVILDDDEVDSDFELIRESLIQAVRERTVDGEFLLDVLMIAKYIERVGDHATNLAEWVVYSITGAHPEETN
ncbi:MAG: phosphate signaling complex protein PhoU, partial [Firmicutes bacterium]|nr:phosphate signaling complex protein PhoU [Bacillota bacterium]